MIMCDQDKTNNISVVGAGIMGRGIALALAKAGLKPTLIELYADLNEIKAILLKQLARAKLDADAVVLTNDLAAARDSQLVIEAILEDQGAKSLVLQKLSALCSAETVFASNTSSLSITDLSRSLARPENFIGLHFFNPAELIDFVEIVPGARTAEAAVKAMEAFAAKTNKKSIVVKDTPGFIVNRLLFVLINEAAFMLQAGVASAQEINQAMKLGAGFPMGPLAMADLIGLDVCLSILESLNARIPNGKYEPCPLFKEMIKLGYLGRKAKKGFYNLGTTLLEVNKQ